MSEQDTITADVLKKLAYLTRDYMPEARWTVEGAFRFDFSIRQMAQNLKTRVGVRQIHRVAGVSPCLWSLDWFSQRRPLPGPAYLKLLDTYTKEGFGFTLVFDNPFIREEDIKDGYGMFLVSELVKRNAAHNHAVSVASDRLAAHLKQQFPALSIHCHVNRLLVEPTTTTRDAAFYNQLAQRYNRVCLHPADAVNPAIYTAIKEPARMDVIINDPCLRSCPARAQHLHILANYRREPYNPLHGQQRIVLLNQVGCLRIDKSALQQKQACNLTKAESRALYAAGFRSFIIQSQQFKNEITLMWDMVQCMFEATPELSNKVALVNTSLLTPLNPHPKRIASGLKEFSTSDFD